jgi:hypothetical protein
MLRATPLSLGRSPRSVRDHWPGGRAAGGWRAGARRAGSRSGWRAAGGFATRFSPELSTNPGRPTASGPYIRRRIRSSQLILRRSACWSTAGLLGYGGTAGWRAPVTATRVSPEVSTNSEQQKASGPHIRPRIRSCQSILRRSACWSTAGCWRGGLARARTATRVSPEVSTNSEQRTASGPGNPPRDLLRRAPAGPGGQILRRNAGRDGGGAEGKEKTPRAPARARLPLLRFRPGGVGLDGATRGASNSLARHPIRSGW